MRGDPGCIVLEFEDRVHAQHCYKYNEQSPVIIVLTHWDSMFTCPAFNLCIFGILERHATQMAVFYLMYSCCCRSEQE